MCIQQTKQKTFVFNKNFRVKISSKFVTAILLSSNIVIHGTTIIYTESDTLPMPISYLSFQSFQKPLGHLHYEPK